MLDRCFAGQGFLVVGPSGGAAHRAALIAARRGALVLYSAGDNDPSGVQSTACHGATLDGSKGLFVESARLASRDRIDQAIEHALLCLPSLDVLVQEHAVRSLDRGKLLADMSTADWAEAALQPLRAAFLVTQSVVQAWLSLGRGGRIVQVLHESLHPDAGQAVMQTALASLVRSVAMEYGRRGISCNAAVVSEFGSTGLSAAEAILFLASSEASFVNAEVLHAH